MESKTQFFFNTIRRTGRWMEVHWLGWGSLLLTSYLHWVDIFFSS